MIGVLVAVVAIASTAGGITASAVTGGGGNASGPEADAAAAAAIAIVGGGTLLEVEHADDEGAVWEVEVRKDNGDEVEVLLDGNLNEVGIFANDDANEGPDDESVGGPDDDSIEDEVTGDVEQSE